MLFYHKKVVAVLTNQYDDLSTRRLELLHAITKAGYKLIILCPGAENLNEAFKNENVILLNNKVDRRGKNPIKDMELFTSYLKFFVTYRPFCVLTFTIKPNLYGGIAARVLGIPNIMNITGLGSSLLNKGKLRSALFLLYQRATRKAGCVFFQNRTNFKIFKLLKIECPNYRLLPGSGVNLQKNRLEDYPIEDGTIRFLFVARIMEAKGIKIIVEGSKILKKKYPDIDLQFHVIGYCEDGYESYIDKAKKKKLIIYHGPQSNVHQFMKMCHALVHPSFYPEGMSNVCLEASATGRPVLTTLMPGCRETVDDQKTGILFQPKSVESFVEAVEEFLTLTHEEKIQMGLAARKKVEKEFDRKIVIQSYLEEINKLV